MNEPQNEPQAGDDFELSETGVAADELEVQDQPDPEALVVEPVDVNELRRQMSELLEVERGLRSANRELWSENRELRLAAGNPLSEPSESVATDESTVPQGSRGYLGDRLPFVGGHKPAVNDLVLEAPRVSRDELKELVREVVKESLPRQRWVPVHDPFDGPIQVDALEVASKTLPALAAMVRKLLGRAYRVPEDLSWTAAGLSESDSALLDALADGASRNPAMRIQSKTL